MCGGDERAKGQEREKPMLKRTVAKVLVGHGFVQVAWVEQKAAKM